MVEDPLALQKVGVEERRVQTPNNIVQVELECGRDLGLHGGNLFRVVRLVAEVDVAGSASGGEMSTNLEARDMQSAPQETSRNERETLRLNKYDKK